jgi:DNA replication protein DnaC
LSASEKRVGQKSIAELTAMAMGSLPKLTDEQWEDRDAEVQAERDEVQRAANEKRARQLRQALVNWGVPVKDIERVCLAQLNDTPAMTVVREDVHGILVLSGKIGCGKTTAAAWWIAQEVKVSPYLKVKDPLFIPIYKLERTSRYDDEAMGCIERAKRLVVDDLGGEFLDSKNAFVALLRGLIDARYNNALPMLITTNLTGSQFEERYGERVIDRIREIGRFVELKGDSLRGGE